MKPISKKYQLPLDHLEGMQSVRTTFRFTKGAQSALDYLRKRLKITAKEMFDKVTQLVLSNNKFTDMIKDITGANTETEPTETRRTWVISKTTLSLVNKTAKAMGISRDSLVENSILLLEALVKAADQKRPENHKKALEMIDKFWAQAENIREKLVDLLGEDDLIAMQFGDVLSTLGNLREAIEAEIKQGIPVSPEF